MEKINLIGGPFQHAYSSTWWKKPTHFEWVKNQFTENVTFFVDNQILTGLKYKQLKGKKYAWNLESRAIFPLENIFKHIDILLDYYNLIFTHSQELIDINPDKIKFIPGIGFWIEEPKIYEKSKLVSIISSKKNSTEGQVERMNFILKNRDKLDIFGRGFNPIEKKEEGLKDYMFSVAIENLKYAGHFSEKILDCFATGTIPIYRGADDIFEIYNPDGIIKYEEFDFDMLTPEYYYSKMDAIKENFETVLKYEIPEDIIYEKYLKNN